jgi:hypothetical protein
LPAADAYNAGMQYTLRNIPKAIDQALRKKAKAEGKSLNSVLLDAVKASVGLDPEPTIRRDLSDIAGSWVADPAVEQALRDQDQIDPELWR